LGWHIVVETNGVSAGMISCDSMKTMPRATGTASPQNDTFKLIAKELGGHARSVKVDGQIGDNGSIIAEIQVPNVVCNAVVVPVNADTPGTNSDFLPKNLSTQCDSPRQAS
jgi:hypothetical protein